jgi:hypothetical protein
MVERNDSANNLAIEIPAHPVLAAASATTSPFDESGSKGGSDEVTIVVGRRKNSTTKAVRYFGENNLGV